MIQTTNECNMQLMARYPDKEYYEAGLKRLKQHQQQLTIL